jgi:heavy metal sensor kinase
MLESVRVRLTLWYAAVLACTLLILFLATYWIVRQSLLSRKDASLVALSDSFLVTFNDELLHESHPNGAADVAQQTILEHGYPGLTFAVMDASGGILATSENAQGTSSANRPDELLPSQSLLEACVGREPGSNRKFRTIPGKHEGYRCFVRDFAASGAIFKLAILASMHPEEELLKEIRISFGWMIPFAVALASTGGYFLARKSLSPVSAMTERAGHISEVNLHQRLPVENAHDELGRLASTFNGLLERLDQAFDRQRRFIADASHELRTPVAILQGEAEVALSQASRSSAEYRESLTFLHQETRRLARIVEDLFTLTRADSGQYPITPREFYLDELAGECAQSMRSIAEEKGISLKVSAPEELKIFADESLLRRMLINLMSNAIKYAPAGGRVEVACRQVPGGAELSVSDNGPGIPPEQQQRIFERFFRGDQARTRTGDDGGAGLGLSIARWIAEVHNGRLNLAKSDSTGSTFTAWLPLGKSSLAISS